MSTTSLEPNKLKRAKLIIYTLSVLIPVVVAVLTRVKVEGVDWSFLPSIYATINGITSIVLVFALVAIKQKRQRLHAGLIRFALILSLFFLAGYVAYHMTSGSTTYEGSYPVFYYSLLISHIVLSACVIPIVLFTYLFAWQGDFDRHKRWTRFAWPLWFYVAVSGVIVYWMIAPFYS